MIDKELVANLLPVIYLLASAGFILAIKWMSSPATARRGVIIGEIGMPAGSGRARLLGAPSSTPWS